MKALIGSENEKEVGKQNGRRWSNMGAGNLLVDEENAVHGQSKMREMEMRPQESKSRGGGKGIANLVNVFYNYFVPKDGFFILSWTCLRMYLRSNRNAI